MNLFTLQLELIASHPHQTSSEQRRRRTLRFNLHRPQRQRWAHSCEHNEPIEQLVHPMERKRAPVPYVFALIIKSFFSTVVAARRHLLNGTRQRAEILIH